MDTDLIECPCCGSDACSKTTSQDGSDIYLCWTCGMTTNSLMEDGSDFEKENYEQTAEIIKDLKQVHDNLAWYPKVINLHENGMVFPEWNKRVKDWYWAAVKAIPVMEEEKEKYPDPNSPGEFYKFRMDIKNIKRYDKLCFMDAAEQIGMFGS
jgi:DNA-directed RNA polymerase subunit RPC12/RpoP